MVAPAHSSSGASQAAIDNAAAQRAAEEQRRRAEEAARRAAEEAQRIAAEARRLAAEARKKADEARKLADAAEAKKAQTQAEQDAAAKLRAQAKTDELDALKKEATANLRTKEETLANSKLDDVRQRRAPSDPSEATRAAQSEVDAAQKTQALYAPAAGAQGADQPAPSTGTQALLEKAQAAAKPVFDAQARGGDGSKEEKAALNVAVTDWLDAAQQDMRTAGLKAQADGKDSNAAIDQEAARINQAIDKGGVFDPEQMGAYIDKAQAGVKGETPEIRQLRSEQYNVNQSGKKQVADARTEATDADAAADKAEQYAAGFGDGPGGNDTIVTAKQNAKDEAARLRGVANRADARLDGLIKAFGTSDPADPANPNTNVVGAVNADYNARAADLEVKDLNAKYDQVVAGGDPAKIAEADAALRDAQDGQRYMRALADDEAAKLDRSDAEIEYTDAEGAWNAESQVRPGTYTVTERDGDKTTTKTVEAEGYDPAFWAKPGSEEGKKVQASDGKYYYVDGDKKTELDPVTSRLWAAHDKREADTKRVGDTGSALAKVKEDLIGGADGSGPRLDAGRYLDNADAINQRLADANAGVAAAQAGTTAKRPEGFIGPVAATPATPQQLGAALEKQRTAQAEADALKAMQDLRSAERDQAAGKPVGAAKLEGLRKTAREAQNKHEESQPRLSAADENKMRNEQLPQARSDYQAKSDKVDKLTAPGSTATEAERDKALDELDTAKLTVRDYETQLELIDAERDWYAAQNQYGQTDFAKPKLSMFMKNGESVTADVYPENYDPTWNIKPGKDGKVIAEGLPRGLSPDDIEVRFDQCGGGYTVIVKKDSDVVGWQKSERYGDMRNFVVREGEYKMNPATARLWDTSEFGNGRLAQARSERGTVEQQLRDAKAEAPPAPGEEPLIGPDGKPVPTLRLGDDLTQRKKTVDQNVGTATTERDKAQAAYDAGTGDRTALKNALDDANSSLTIAKNEQAAVDAVLLWQEASRTRQLYEANERAGRAQPVCYAKPPSELESDARAKAVEARSTWLGSHNTFHTASAKRDLGTAQAAHDKWKRENPSLAETGSDTWQALQAAQGKADIAQRYLAAGATEGASAREQNFIAQNLRPDQHGDGAELYKLFMKDPELMAQSIINSHYVQYGGQFTQMQNRTQLANQVAIALGWTPDIALDPATPANNERLQQTQNLFGNLGKDQKEILDKTVDKLVELGGDKARVMVLPVVYGIEGEQGGIVKTALFKVETKPGEAKYVDEQGWEYESLDDYRANNNLPVEGVNLVTPEDGNFTLDADGNVKLFSGDARTETGWETFRRKSHLDVVAGVAGVVAGVVLTVGSLGTLSAPGVMLIAGSAAALAAGYGIATSTESLVRQSSHGQNINPLTSTQARLDWLNLGLSAVSVPVVGASTRATMQAMRARSALKAATTAGQAGDAAAAGKHLADVKRYAESAATWGRPAAAAAKPLGVGSVVAFEEGARYTIENWEHMSSADREKQLGMLGLNLAGFASPVFARGYVRVHNAVKPMVNTAQGQMPPATHATQVNEGAPDGSNVVPLASRRNPAVVDDPQRIAAAAAEDPLLPFREQPAPPSEPRPDNVRVLHPDGAPFIPAEVPDAPLAPVHSLLLRRSGEGPDPGPGSVPASARRSQEQQLSLAVGADVQAPNAPFTRSPHRQATVRQLSAQASANNQGGTGARGEGGQGQQPVNPQGQGQQGSGPSASLPSGSTGARPPATNPTAQASSAAGGRSTAGFDADGVPLPPTTLGRNRSWASVAGHANGLIRRQQLAGQQDPHAKPLQPSADEAAVTAALMEDPPAGSSVRFVVSKLGPRDTIYANRDASPDAVDAGKGGVRVRNRDTYDNFAEASAAAARNGGGWVHRVQPDAAKLPLSARRKAAADEIAGAVHVNGENQVLPIGVPNARDAAALAAATGVPTWKQGIKGMLSAEPKDGLIHAKRWAAFAAGARMGAEVIKPVFGWPADRAGGATAGYLSYPLSSFGRAAYLTAAQRMKESMAAATRGDRETAEKLANKVINGSGWRGDKIMDEAKAQSLRDKVNEVAKLGETLKTSREAWPDAPSEKNFQLHTIRSPGEMAETLAPARYMKGVAGLRDFYDGLRSEFPNKSKREIGSELLLRIDKMSADELRLAGDRSHPDNSPEARLLREFPEVHARFSNSAKQRTELRDAHAALYEKLETLFSNKKNGGVDPQEAEGLGGSTNSPSTRLGQVSRRATIAVSLNTFVGTFFKPLNAGNSLQTHAGNFADGLSIGTLAANYIYNNKVDALETVKSNITAKAKAANMNEDDYLGAHPKLAAEKEAAQIKKDAWNKYRDYAGLLSAGRAGAVGVGLLETGPEILAYGAFAQGALTLTWVGLQQIPALRNGAFPTTTKILKWSAVGSIAVVPAATVLYKALAGTEQEKKDSVVQMVWNGFTGLFEADPAKPGQPTPSTGPTPTSPPSSSPTTPPGHEPGEPEKPGEGEEQKPPKQPIVKPIFVTVDGERRETATLWGISETNLQTLLTAAELGAARQEGGKNHVVSEALSQLFNLNPRFDKRLMDGIATNIEGDPDTLIDGWQIKVGQTTT
ncbi:DUF4781 domain-containing protein [Variovorax sp. DT-64]|uniref:DUF4781 domain-containing protein n=1 Tax=Variovorax sp. DT-64 TaxID=3396160 RepID=UPI003F1DB3F8